MSWLLLLPVAILAIVMAVVARRPGQFQGTVGDGGAGGSGPDGPSDGGSDGGDGGGD